MWGNNMKQKMATNMVRQAEHRIESLVRIIGLVGLMTLAVACSRNSEITAEELPGIWKVVDGRGYFQPTGKQQSVVLAERKPRRKTTRR